MERNIRIEKKFENIISNYINGNISICKKQIHALRKITLVEFVIYCQQTGKMEIQDIKLYLCM